MASTTTAGLGVGGAPNIGVDGCPEGSSTTLSGTVYDPAGKLPLYNVVVYVPTPGAILPVFTDGVSCERCEGRTASALAVALSDAEGKFRLEGLPAGSDVPLVVEVGKWRRQVTIPQVKACQDNTLDDPELSRLPRNQEEGDLPRIAVSTGHSDALECLFRKLGIDDAEFTTDSGSGRVHMFVGCPHDEQGEGANHFSAELGGETFPQSTDLYASSEKLDRYDMLVLSCEGHGCLEEKDGYYDNLKAYGDKGGRIFLDHMHFNWINHSDHEWEGSADIVGTGTDLPSPQIVNIDDSFPKGAALKDWLVNVGASSTPGELEIIEGQWSVRAHTPPKSQRWIYLDSHPLEGDSAVQYLTINTPVELAETEPENQCGRIVYTDLHVATAGADFSDNATPFPGGCVTSELSPQEKALAFMVFDLSACVQTEDAPPRPPEIIK